MFYARTALRAVQARKHPSYPYGWCISLMLQGRLMSVYANDPRLF